MVVVKQMLLLVNAKTKNYTVCLPNNYVEVVNENHELIGYESEGYAVITNLYNKAMPLIRYNLSDRIIMSDGESVIAETRPP